MNEKRKDKRTKFTNREIDTLSPEGYILPLVYGLKSLLKTQMNRHGYTEIVWKEDPMEFLKKNLKNIIRIYSEIFTICDYDPQKIGKAALSYQMALREFDRPSIQ